MGLMALHQGAGAVMAFWRMTEDWETLCDTVDNPELVEEAIRRFVSQERRMEWLAVRALLNVMRTGKHEIAYYPSGRPYLTDGSFEISISHTKGFVAILLGDVPVGIDIEYYSHRVHRVKSRFVRPDEEVLSYRGDDTFGLLLIWTAKEAVYKVMNREGVDFLEHLQVLPFEEPLAENGTIRVQEHLTSQHRVFEVFYSIDCELVTSWLYDK